MPGMIDIHVHIGYHFGKDGRAQNQGETPAEMALYAAENAWTTLLNGVTTVQSSAPPSDKDLRDAIAPASAGPAHPDVARLDERATGTPEQLRECVRKRSGRRRPDQDLRVEEHPRRRRADDDARAVEAACGEAKTQGLRTLVHAHAADAVIATPRPGARRSSTARTSATKG